MAQRILFHVPRSWLGPLGAGLMPFYEKLTDGLSAAGVAFDLCALDRDQVMDQVAADAHFHIINHGRFEHPRILNAGVAYIYPFWNLDPLGIRAFSSIATARFDPGSVDGDAAGPFFRRLRKRLVGARRSRYEQPEPVATDLPENAVSVFFQSEGHRIVGETCYLERWQMLETVLACADGPVIVKPHPRDTDPETLDRLSALSRDHPNLLISGANIHDILAVSSRVVTINSAVGVEAYLHRKPVILCGQADFHHIAQTAKSTDDLARYLQDPPRRRAYDKYIYWYFGLNCLSTSDPQLTQRFLSRLRAHGYTG